MGQVEAHIEARQRDAANDLIDMIKFGFFGAHKLAARRRVVEQIQHFQRGADRMRRGFNGHILIAPLRVGLPGLLLLLRA